MNTFTTSEEVSKTGTKTSNSIDQGFTPRCQNCLNFHRCCVLTDRSNKSWTWWTIWNRKVVFNIDVRNERTQMAQHRAEGEVQQKVHQHFFTQQLHKKHQFQLLQSHQSQFQCSYIWRNLLQTNPKAMQQGHTVSIALIPEKEDLESNKSNQYTTGKANSMFTVLALEIQVKRGHKSTLLIFRATQI